MKLHVLMILVVLVTMTGVSHSKVTYKSDTAFSIEREVILPLTPTEAYDVMTGDISGWWDHKFSEAPTQFFIDPKPGGGFYEIFDDGGDGVLHGTVIYAQRGKLLRFEGPLGFSGKAVNLVMTYAYEADEAGTRVKLTVNAAGRIEEGWAEAVDRLWYHFLIEQLKPYVESGRYRK